MSPIDQVRISIAGLRQAPQIAMLHARLFDQPWDEGAVGSLLSQPSSLALVGQLEDSLAGFVMAQAAADEAEILSIGVDPTVQRQSIGRKLLEALIEELRRRGSTRLFLEVAVDNPAAVALYQALGFREAGRRPSYYARVPGPSADALILTRQI